MRKKKIKSRVNIYRHGLNSALPKNIERGITKITDIVFREEKNTKPYKISVILTSDKNIKSLNIKFLSRNRPTDVICFPYSSKENIEGDIFISVETSLRQSKEYSHTFRQEILFLVIHGILHLLGWDDLKKPLREKMCKRQEYILSLATP